MMYIFDIDGTIADISHRLHFIDGSETQQHWDAFFEACDKDTPIYEVLALLRTLSEHNDIVFVTGRSDKVRAKTEAWLNTYCGNWTWQALFMRKDGDHRPDHVVKSELFDEVLKQWNKNAILGVFEDRKQVVEMWRSRGLRCYQVAEGNF